MLLKQFMFNHFLKRRRYKLFQYQRSYQSAINHFSSIDSIVGKDQVIIDEDGTYTTDWLKHYKGGSVVCFPRSTEDISKILKYCNDNNIGVVPQGGNTGLVGGSVGVSNELIISTKFLNKIISIDTISGVLVCEAGCIIQNLMDYVSLYGYLLPIDLGSKGTCVIGGNIASNSGGMRVLKYGSWYANILGLEVVLANGTVLDMLRTIKKDNCGYSLKHYFVGSEGTLGYITKVAIQLYPAPRSSLVLFAQLQSFEKLPEIFSLAKFNLGEILSAFEMIDSPSFELLKKINPQIIQRFKDQMVVVNTNHSVYFLLEIHSGSENFSSHYERLETFLGPLISSGVITSAIISQDQSHEQDIWAIRESVPLTLAQCSKNNSISGPFLLKYDISVPLHLWMEVTNEILNNLNNNSIYHSDSNIYAIYDNITYISEGNVEDSIEPNYDCLMKLHCFGHAGDQNLHLNVLLSFSKKVLVNNDINQMKSIKELAKKKLELSVLNSVKKRNGSISAEHGIGQQKRHLMKDIRSNIEVEMMKSIKNCFDPKNILNPGKIF